MAGPYCPLAGCSPIPPTHCGARIPVAISRTVIVLQPSIFHANHYFLSRLSQLPVATTSVKHAHRCGHSCLLPFVTPSTTWIVPASGESFPSFTLRLLQASLRSLAEAQRIHPRDCATDHFTFHQLIPGTIHVVEPSSPLLSIVKVSRQSSINTLCPVASI